jgi:hypothetical protein
VEFFFPDGEVPPFLPPESRQQEKSSGVRFPGKKGNSIFFRIPRSRIQGPDREVRLPPVQDYPFLKKDHLRWISSSPF